MYTFILMGLEYLNEIIKSKNEIGQKRLNWKRMDNFIAPTKISSFEYSLVQKFRILSAYNCFVYKMLTKWWNRCGIKHWQKKRQTATASAATAKAAIMATNHYLVHTNTANSKIRIPHNFANLTNWVIRSELIYGHRKNK